MAQDKLIMTLLLIQIEAIIGALFFSWLSKKIGNTNVISITVIMWIGACLAAYYLNKENPVTYLQSAKNNHMVKLVEKLSDEDCRKVYDDYNFACLKDLVEWN